MPTECDTCRFHYLHQCRRHAPVPEPPSAGAPDGAARWPYVLPGSWCGDWEPELCMQKAERE